MKRFDIFFKQFNFGLTGKIARSIEYFGEMGSTESLVKSLVRKDGTNYAVSVSRQAGVSTNQHSYYYKKKFKTLEDALIWLTKEIANAKLNLPEFEFNRLLMFETEIELKSYLEWNAGCFVDTAPDLFLLEQYIDGAWRIPPTK